VSSIKYKKNILYIGHSSPISFFFPSPSVSTPPLPKVAHKHLALDAQCILQDQILKTNSNNVLSLNKLTPISSNLLRLKNNYLAPTPRDILTPTRNYGGGVNPLQVTAIAIDINISWRPSTLLSVRRSQHPLDVACSQQELREIMRYSNRDETVTFVRHQVKEDVHVTTKDLRDLLSHFSPIADETITLYLELLSTQYNFAYLATTSIPQLQQEGWSKLKRNFAFFRNRPRTNTRPTLNGEPVIIIPCFIHNCHWVTVVRREISGEVRFLYADDLNNPTTEEVIKRLLSTSNTSSSFHPPGASWISCRNYTYVPHSNECGPRSLVAATILAIHPDPTHLSLLPLMHPNLAQIARTWVAKSLFTNQIDHSAIQQLIAPHSLIPRSNIQVPSQPFHLIPWQNFSTPNTTSPIPQKPKSRNITEELKQQSLVRASSKLNPLAKEFLPRKQLMRSIRPSIQATKATDRTTKPSKRMQGVLPGQRLLSAFFQQTNPVQHEFHHTTLSLSIPSESCSQETTTTSNKALSDKISLQISKKPTLTGQKTLYDFAYFKPQSTSTESDPEVWGHIPESIDTTTTFRVLLQNPNGIKPSVTEPEFLFSLHVCQDIGVGAICLAETNLNWHHTHQKISLRRCLQRNWSSSRFQPSIPSEQFLGTYQPGGTATIVVDRWTSRIITTGMDPHNLGRWSYIILRGKSDSTICIITAYRVCKVKYTGPKTAYQQQKRQLSSIFRDQNKMPIIDPHKQFIVDLQSWIASLQSTGTQIILCLDNNEELLPNKGKLITLPFSEKPLIHPTHDGTLETLARSTGLIDVLRHHHPSSQYPPTYNRGKKRIDLILASASLLPAIVRSGILPYNSVFQGDHRPCYIDLNAVEAFGGQTSPVCPPCQRSLQLHDPRKVNEYLTALTAQLSLHKVQQKVATLHNKAITGWQEDDQLQYERLDKLITEAMLYAERHTGKRYTKTYEWSPTLVQAVYAERFWRLMYKKSTGRFVSDEHLIRTRSMAGIPTSSAELQLPQILKCLTGARESRKLLQKDHRTLRRNYLEQLAQALVLKRSSAMADPKNADQREKRTAKEVKRLIRLEYKRSLYRLIGNTLNIKNENGHGLSRVDVPAPMVNQPHLLTDPKTWKGPWVSVTDPEEIAQFVCEINQKQYNQAHITPFASQYLNENIGMNLEGPAVASILNGTFQLPHDAPLLPETRRIITTLGTPPAGGRFTFPTLIKVDEFKATYSIVKERTSSSISGRHVGHYKAATQDDQLSQLHSIMMSLPYIVGFSPERWQKVVDVMLEKDPGTPKIHRLRIIALIESDFNQSQRILIARRLSHRMEDIQIIPEMQYGSRPGKLCISPVLNKQLTHDIVRQTKQTIAVIENDAVGCYDRLMNPFILLGMRWLGVPESLAKSIGQTWSHTTHFIKTQFGVSTVSYTNTPQTPLFGPGQGSTTGPTLWQLSFVFLEDSAIEAGLDLSELEEPINQLTLISTDGSTELDASGEAFVDDSNLASPSSLSQHPHEVSEVDQRMQSASALQNLQVLAQRWERSLFSTGGAINFSKSFWFTFHWKWKNGIPYLVDPPESMSLQLTEGDALDSPTNVPRKSVHDTYRTLGVYISPSGCSKESFKILKEKAYDYQTKIASSKIPREAALLSYNVYLLPKLGYPLPALTFTEAQCQSLQSPTLMAFLPKIQLNRHTARSIVFSPIRFGGLGIKSLYSIQGLGQLNLFVGHGRSKDKTSKLLLISLSYLQLAVGSSVNVFHLSPKNYGRWVDSCWLVSFWTFITKLKLQVSVADQWIPSLTRAHDKNLMDYFVGLGYSPAILGTLNRCRLYLQIITLSDIVSADGSCIITDVFQGLPLLDRKSTLKWPNQQRPPSKDWEIWASALRSLQPRNSLLQPLGQWMHNNSHQSWFWFKAAKSPIFYYHDGEDNWISHRPLDPGRRRTRSGMSLVLDETKGTPLQKRPQEELLPVSAIQDRYTSLTTVTVGQQKPSLPQLYWPKSTVPSLLMQDAYFSSFYTNYQFPDEEEYQQVAQECSSGLTVLYRSYYKSDCMICGWILYSTTSSMVLHKGVIAKGTIPGISSSQRVELESLLLVLNLLRCILHRFSVTGGKIHAYCLSKKLTKLVRGILFRSVASALDDHGDLLAELSYILRRIQHRASVTFQHLDLSNGKGPPIPLHNIDQLGTEITNLQDSLEPPPSEDYLNPPNNPVLMKYQGQPLLIKVKATLRQEMYLSAIQATICKQEDWSDLQFQLVDWAAHEYAFLRAWSCRRVTYTKLAHKLLPTNTHNKKLYGKSDLCPCCAAQPETLLHVLTCHADQAKTFRLTQQRILWKHLELIDTPDEILQAIQSGILHLEGSNLTPRQFSAPVTAAYRAQILLGWEPFLRGRISSSWRTVFSGEDAVANPKQGQKWAGQLVGHLMNYSQQLWVFRCGIVHGHTIAENRQRHREELHRNVKAAYDEYLHDPFCVPTDWRHLFSKPIDLILHSDRDSLMCWLRSFSEARQLQDLASLRQASNAKQYFFPVQSPKPCTSSVLGASSPSSTIQKSSAGSSKLHALDDNSWSESDDDSTCESDSDSESSILDYNPFSTPVFAKQANRPPIEELDTG
jgi:hypothetical protein